MQIFKSVLWLLNLIIISIAKAYLNMNQRSIGIFKRFVHVGEVARRPGAWWEAGGRAVVSQKLGQLRLVGGGNHKNQRRHYNNHDSKSVP
jgi:hypothetical protein